VFDQFVLVLIVFNTVVLAFDRYPISDGEANLLNTLNFALTVTKTF